MRTGISAVFILISCVLISTYAESADLKDGFITHVYNKQEQCNFACENFARQHSSDINNYRAHYNRIYNRCFCLFQLIPIKIGYDGRRMRYVEQLYLVDDRKACGQLATHHSDNADMVYEYLYGDPYDVYQCSIDCRSKREAYDGGEAKGKWSEYINEMMEK